MPVQTLFEYLEGGETLEDFLEGFPTVARSLAIEALEEAKQLLLCTAPLMKIPGNRTSAAARSRLSFSPPRPTASAIYCRWSPQ